MQHRRNQLVAITLLTSLAAAAFVPIAHAESRAAQQLESRFQAADRNGDGQLTRAEAEAGMPRLAARFDQIDTAQRGYITLEQLKAVAAARKTG